MNPELEHRGFHPNPTTHWRELGKLGYPTGAALTKKLIPEGIAELLVVPPQGSDGAVKVGPVRIRAHDAQSGLTVLATARGDYFAFAGQDLIMTFSEYSADQVFALFLSNECCWITSDLRATIAQADEAFALARDRRMAPPPVCGRSALSP